MSKTIRYEVIEDNGGGLHLAVFDDNNKVAYIHSGYEYTKGSLVSSIEELKSDNNCMENWDGNCGGVKWEFGTDPQALYDNITSYEYGWKIVADNNGIYSDKMGYAAKFEFGMEE